MTYLVADLRKYKKTDIKNVRGEAKRELNEYRNKVDLTKSNQNIHWCKDSSDVSDLKSVRLDIENRIKSDKRLRKDANLLAGILVSMSPSAYDGLSDVEKRDKAIAFTADCRDYLASRFGEDNIYSIDIHMDETTPHTHFGLIPVTDDGRLSYKDLFNRRAYSDLHSSKQGGMIDYLNAKGWDLEEIPKNKSAKHVDPHVYAESLEQLAALDELKKEKEKEIKSLDNRIHYKRKKADAAYTQVDDLLKSREDALAARESELNEFQSNLEQQRLALIKLEDTAYKRAYKQAQSEFSESYNLLNKQQMILDEREIKADMRDSEQDLREEYQNAREDAQNAREGRFMSFIDSLHIPHAQTLKTGLKRFFETGKTYMTKGRSRAEFTSEDASVFVSSRVSDDYDISKLDDSDELEL